TGVGEVHEHGHKSRAQPVVQERRLHVGVRRGRAGAAGSIPRGVRFTESPRHPHVGLKRANSPVGPKLKAHVEGSDAQQFIRAAAANNLDRLDAMLKVRPGLVAAPWSYGDARRALQYALMDRAPELVRMLRRAVEEHS